MLAMVREFFAANPHRIPASIKESELVPVGSSQFHGMTRLTYECPCGGDHVATRPYRSEGFSQSPCQILTCYQSDPPRQWFIIDDRPMIADVVLGEEKKYFDTLARNEKTLRKRYPTPESVAAITGEELVKLHHTHGADPEVVAACVGELPASAVSEYARLWESRNDATRLASKAGRLIGHLRRRTTC